MRPKTTTRRIRLIAGAAGAVLAAVTALERLREQ